MLLLLLFILYIYIYKMLSRCYHLHDQMARTVSLNGIRIRAAIVRGEVLAIKNQTTNISRGIIRAGGSVWWLMTHYLGDIQI